MGDSEHEDDAMREMMGFSSFGSNKRKKLNSGAVSSLPPKPPTTAGNSTPLGERKNKPKSPLSMIPASLPPSGRASASPPPPKDGNEAKLPNTVKGGESKRSEDRADQNPEQTQESTSDGRTNATATASSRNSLNASADTFLPTRPALGLSQDPQSTTTQAPTTTTIYSANDIRSDPSYWTSNANANTNKRAPTHPRDRNTSRYDNTNENEIAYTSPYTDISMTRKELREYATGKRETMEDGSVVTVFFKPSFLATPEELWGRWLPTDTKLKDEDGMGNIGANLKEGDEKGSEVEVAVDG
ncbi:hypothetical protein OHC33_004825 [Knufia fluminis]|uniref:Uncharacterized protein n=1 Tax=Knufia fluminis TaxID=191047 RepID=A0AAN8EMG3_9EURO|nr:hypothetical protein OHC33_004825 [Knufia fluminis]